MAGVGAHGNRGAQCWKKGSQAVAGGCSLHRNASRPPDHRQQRGIRTEIGCQLAAFLMSAPILSSLPAVNSFSANSVGHMLPSSSLALSLKPSVAYLLLNLS